MTLLSDPGVQMLASIYGMLFAAAILAMVAANRTTEPVSVVKTKDYYPHGHPDAWGDEYLGLARAGYWESIGENTCQKV